MIERVSFNEVVSITKHNTLTKRDAIDLARQCGAVVWEGTATVAKYHEGDDMTRATPYEVISSEPNLLLTAGATAIWNRLANQGSVTALDGTNCRVCVGNGTAAAAIGQTDLQGASKFRKVVDAAPTISTNSFTAVSTLSGSEALFSIDEVGVANSASGATLINRIVQAFGVHSSGNWVITVALSLS